MRFISITQGGMWEDKYEDGKWYLRCYGLSRWERQQIPLYLLRGGSAIKISKSFRRLLEQEKMMENMK